ncbi:MAG: 50S ribosomal protein L25 [Candidatus Eisenbacteria bacterium]|nr:50S ribosomal protein L25 [Candidatus Latescibacterota bacterium]MBD3301088.1 50S ribosomal protein L25 [Candidatus Eisenbacteria bacterium]
MQKVEIRGVPRTGSRKSGARQLRAGGKIPAVIYGKTDTQSITIDLKEFEGILRTHGHGAFLLEMKLEGSAQVERLVLLKEVQRDPITSRVLHIDFLQISMDQLIQVKVPVHLEGTPIGVKEGGLLDVLSREVEIECKAAEIPEDIKYDISEAAIGHSVHVSDLVPPQGVEILTPDNRVIATVISKVLEAEAAAAEEAAPEEAGEGEGEGEEKKEEEDASEESKAGS